MLRWLLLAIVLLTVSMFSGCASAKGGSSSATSSVYVCDCSGTCTKCAHVAAAPGKCGCGHDLVAHHVIALEGSTATVCSCPGECSCKLSSDATKCTCGKPVEKVSLAGQGFYTCTCGGACGCSLVMPGPGKCGCGKDLVPIK